MTHKHSAEEPFWRHVLDWRPGQRKGSHRKDRRAKRRELA